MEEDSCQKKNILNEAFSLENEDAPEDSDDDIRAEGATLLHMIKSNWSTKGLSTVVFFDDGSTNSIITFKFARFLGLWGTKVTRYIQLAGLQWKRYDTTLFKLPIQDRVHSEGIRDVQYHIQPGASQVGQSS